MARAIFAWELGGDLADVRRAQHVAHEWRARGHEFAFVFPDLTPLGAPNDASVEWFQAPLLPPAREQTLSPLSFSGILLNRGYGDAAGIVGALRGWFGLFDLWKPDVVIADYAPGAQIAARAAGVRCIAIGSAFSQPIVADPMPPLRSWIAVEESVLRKLDARVTNAVRDAFARVDAHARAPEGVPAILKAHANLLCTWPEVDPLGPREAGDYIGTQDDPQAGLAVQWNGQARPRVFAYLKPNDPRFAALLEAIRAMAADAVIVAIGLAPAQAQMLSTPSARVLSEPVGLNALLAECDLCICHGGAGIAERALQAGVPMALLPLQLEQFLVSRRVVAAGAGVMAAPDASPPDLKAWFNEALARDDLRQAAAASTLRSRKRESAALRIEQVLAG